MHKAFPERIGEAPRQMSDDYQATTVGVATTTFSEKRLDEKMKRIRMMTITWLVLPIGMQMTTIST